MVFVKPEDNTITLATRLCKSSYLLIANSSRNHGIYRRIARCPLIQHNELTSHATLETRGLRISPASVSRLRAGLKAVGAKEDHPSGDTGAGVAL